jgi:hypothetical protein
LTGDRNDVTQLLPLLDKIPTVAILVGRPRRRPDALLADRGYDHDKYRRLLWQRGIRPVIAERGQPHGSGLGIFRYVVERTTGRAHPAAARRRPDGVHRCRLHPPVRHCPRTARLAEVPGRLDHPGPPRPGQRPRRHRTSK